MSLSEQSLHATSRNSTMNSSPGIDMYCLLIAYALLNYNQNFRCYSTQLLAHYCCCMCDWSIANPFSQGA